VLGVRDEHHLVLIELDCLDVGADDSADEACLHLLAHHHAQDLIGATRLHGDLHAGKALVVSLQDAWEDVGADGERRAETQATRLQPALLLEGATPLFEGLQRALGVRQEAASGVGEADAAPIAFEQRLAQLALQRLDARRDRRLRQEEGLRRFAEATVPRHLDKGLDLTKVHASPPAIDAAYGLLAIRPSYTLGGQRI
jgi:hypothetical protein